MWELSESSRGKGPPCRVVCPVFLKSFRVCLLLNVLSRGQSPLSVTCLLQDLSKLLTFQSLRFLCWSCHLCRACDGVDSDGFTAPRMRLEYHQQQRHYARTHSKARVVWDFLKDGLAFLDKLVKCRGSNCSNFCTWRLAVLRNERRVE